MNDPRITTVADHGWDGDSDWTEQAVEDGITKATKEIPALYADWCVTNPAVAAWVRDLVALSVQHCQREKLRWVQLGQAPSLLLSGLTGAGKTSEAYGALRALGVSGMRAPWRAVTVTDLYAELRPRSGVDSEAVFERYATACLLMLDDLGAGSQSPAKEEVNYRLIDYRYRNKLPTLITSNLPTKELTAVLGDRVASRLTGMCRHVAIRGGDRRRAAAEAALSEGQPGRHSAGSERPGLTVIGE